MNEAIAMGRWLAQILNDATVQDGGADYRITVTDTAGTVAELSWDSYLEEWQSEEGYDRVTLFMRTHGAEDGTDVCDVCGGYLSPAIVYNRLTQHEEQRAERAADVERKRREQEAGTWKSGALRRREIEAAGRHRLGIE